MTRYDAAIIGSGPAGLEAAINFKIRNKSFILFGRDLLSIKLERAPKIDNYLGFPGISGQELQKRFHEHMSQMDIPIVSEQVSAVFPAGSYFSLSTNKNTYEATTVIVATGVATLASFPGEEAFLGKGVGYCATCDAPLYKGRPVAIIGYSDESVYEANFVSELAERVYYIPMKKTTVPLNDSIQIVEDKIVEIQGEGTVSSLVLANRTLNVDGVFILRESIAPKALVVGIDVKDGFIQVDNAMRTNLPGLFAAGDCTGKPHQYMRAAGQGQTAALNAVAYLDSL